MPLTNVTLSDLQSNAEAGLLYRIRVTGRLKPKRCLVLLHGVGSHEAAMQTLANRIDADTLVVLARGPLQLSRLQFAWFRVSFTATGPVIDTNEADQSRLTLVHFLAHLQKQFDIRPENTLLAGFSQGGIMSASVALTAPASLAGFGILCGRILPEIAPLLASREHLAGLNGFVAHGSNDTTLPVHWAHRSDRWLNDLGVPHTLRVYPCEHAISHAMHADFVQWTASLTAPGA